MLRYLTILALAAFIGCGNAPTPVVTPDPPPPTIEPEPAPEVEPPKVIVAEFSTLDEAIAAFSTACESEDNANINSAKAWIIDQGAAAEAPVAALINGESGLRTQIMSCRILAQLGPDATDTLMALADNHSHKLVRVNAVEQLALIDPPTREIVDFLAAKISDDEEMVQLKAINSLAYLGVKAESAAPVLQEVLNGNESESLRGAAKQALLKVDPRKTFQD